MKLRIAYFGTPEFAGDLLDQLINYKNLDLEVKFVVTQPDRPIGRKKILTPSLVKQIANKNNILVYESLDIPEDQFKKIDIAIIYYYGKIIPAKFLNLPKHGFWNIHFSLLPKYRGATPATYSLMMGDTETGVSLVLTDARLDYGQLISQDKVQITSQETRLELEKKLHDSLVGILEQEISAIDKLSDRLQEQDHSNATYTIIPTRDHGYIPISVLKKAMNNQPLTPDEIPSLIRDYLEKNKLDQSEQFDLKNSAKIIFDYYRGLHAWPGTWTTIDNKRMKIIDASLIDNKFQINTIQLEGEKSKKSSDLNNY